MGLGSKTEYMRALYHKRLHAPPGKFDDDTKLVGLVMEHARRVIAHPTKPLTRRLESLDRHPFAEIALDETLEENPLLDPHEEFLVETQVEKPFSCVMMLDASASMSGEKHLLGSIAVAVLLLHVPPKDSSVILFASRVSSIKDLMLEEPPEATVLRFLRQQPRGFTNIADALEEGQKQLHRKSARRRRVGLILTDGRSTEGGDPLESAAKYDFLVVLHLHGPGSHLDASKEIAQKGNGICLEVETFEQMPFRLYDALRMISCR